MEKQKMLYQQARLHDRGAAEMVLQMISASKGRDPFSPSDVLELPATVWCGDCGELWSSGRLGAMVTFTLKLGISILNGGNILVQQVCVGPAGCTHVANAASSLFTAPLCWCRKCWTTWRKNEMLAFSKVCQDSWCRAGKESSSHTLQTRTFSFVYEDSQSCR